MNASSSEINTGADLGNCTDYSVVNLQLGGKHAPAALRRNYKLIDEEGAEGEMLPCKGMFSS